MTVRLHLGSSAPSQVRLQISQAAEVLTGMRFGPGSGAYAPLPGGEDTERSVLHGGFSGCGSPPLSRPVGGRRRPGGPVRPLPRAVGVAGQPGRRGVIDTVRRRECAPIREHVAPKWSELRSVLEADLRYRMHRLARGGLPALFEDLHPSVRLDDGVVTLNSRCDAQTVSSSQDQLVLMPSVQATRVVVIADCPHEPPLLIYPALPQGGVWGLPLSATAPLRAAMDAVPSAGLRGMAGACTVDDLAGGEPAGEPGAEPLSAQARLTALVAAGLLAPCPQAPSLYHRTNLASLLAASWCEHCM